MDKTLAQLRLLTARQVSEIVGLSVSTLAKMRLRAGGIPFVKMGTACRYPEDAVAEYVARLPRRTGTRDTDTAA